MSFSPLSWLYALVLSVGLVNSAIILPNVVDSITNTTANGDNRTLSLGDPSLNVSPNVSSPAVNAKTPFFVNIQKGIDRAIRKDESAKVYAIMAGAWDEQLVWEADQLVRLRVSLGPSLRAQRLVWNDYRQWTAWYGPKAAPSSLPSEYTPVNIDYITVPLIDAIEMMQQDARTTFSSFHNVTICRPVPPPTNAPVQMYYVFTQYQRRVYVGAESRGVFYDMLGPDLANDSTFRSISNVTVANGSLSARRIPFEKMIERGYNKTKAVKKYKNAKFLTVHARDSTGARVFDSNQIDYFQIHLLSQNGKHLLEENTPKHWTLWRAPAEIDDPLPSNSKVVNLELIRLTLDAAMHIMNLKAWFYIFDNVTLFQPIIPPRNAPPQIYYLFRLRREMVYVGAQDREVYNYTLPGPPSDGSPRTNDTLYLDYYNFR